MTKAMVGSEEQMVLAAINQSRYIWRPAEAISKQTGIGIRRVRTILRTTKATMVLQHPRRNYQGYVLYTTIEHLMHTSGVIKRYLGTAESS